MDYRQCRSFPLLSYKISKNSAKFRLHNLGALLLKLLCRFLNRPKFFQYQFCNLDYSYKSSGIIRRINDAARSRRSTISDYHFDVCNKFDVLMDARFTKGKGKYQLFCHLFPHPLCPFHPYLLCIRGMLRII